MGATLAETLATSGAEVEARAATEWLLEYVGSGLRTREGITPARAETLTGLVFRPRPILAEGLARGLLSRDVKGQLRLAPAEWFRETAWATEVAMAFTP